MDRPLLLRAGLAALVGLLAAAGLGLLYIAREPDEAPFPSRYVELAHPKGGVDEVPRRFSWQPVEGAARYRVTIEDADTFWPLVLGTTDVTRFDLPEEKRQAIRPGRIHEWSVEALDGDGRAVAWGGSRFWVGPAGEPAGAEATSPAPGSTLPLPLLLRRPDGSSVDPLASSEAAATVFIFTRTDCPIANRYAPEMRRLAGIYAPKGVPLYLVYVDPGETAGSIGRHLAEYSLPLTPLLDAGHDLVRATGARVTPTAVVVTKDRRLAYRGRIDDRYPGYGKALREPSSRDLVLALDAVLAGREIERPETESIGCLIGDVAP